MYINYCSDDFLEVFKTNFDYYIDLYINKDKDGLNSLFNTEHIREGNIKFNYIPLKTSKDCANPEKENIKTVYNSLIQLTPVQASQEKLWVSMYNTYYIDYIFDYVDQNSNHKNFERKLKSSIIFTASQARSLIVQNLARMWWIGYYLYDKENSNNPYNLLDFYTDSTDIIGRSTIFFSSNFSNNINLRLGIIEGIKELVECKIIEQKREYYKVITKYFNLIGGVRILDFMTREEVKSETIDYILDYKSKLIN